MKTTKKKKTQLKKPKSFRDHRLSCNTLVYIQHAARKPNDNKTDDRVESDDNGDM